MKGVKIAVAVMSVMIVLCFVFLIAVIVGRVGGSGGSGGAEGFGQLLVPVPEDCSLADSWSDGGRVYLRYDGDGPCRQVVAVDADKGRVIGRIVSEDVAP